MKKTEWAWVVIVAAFVAVLWAIDRHFEARVTERERIEYLQRQLAEPKLKHM